jgi:hypothetical protein
MKVGNRLAFNPDRVRQHLRGFADYNRFGKFPESPRLK